MSEYDIPNAMQRIYHDMDVWQPKDDFLNPREITTLADYYRKLKAWAVAKAARLKVLYIKG